LNGWRAAVGVATERLGGGRAFAAGVFATLFVGLAAVTLRRMSPAVAVDVTLAYPVLGWTVPLVALGAVARACQGGRLDDAVSALIRHGLSRRVAVAGLLSATVLRVALLSAGLAIAGTLLARGHLGAVALADAFTSAWIGALGGAAYVAWFSLGSLVGRRGGGRIAAFLVDAVAGSAASLLSVPWPRAHLRSLLGGELVLGISQLQSAAVLGLLGCAHVLVCLARAGR
jgi:hypothetical protein